MKKSQYVNIFFAICSVLIIGWIVKCNIVPSSDIYFELPQNTKVVKHNDNFENGILAYVDVEGVTHFWGLQREEWVSLDRYVFSCQYNLQGEMVDISFSWCMLDGRLGVDQNGGELKTGHPYSIYVANDELMTVYVIVNYGMGDCDILLCDLDSNKVIDITECFMTAGISYQDKIRYFTETKVCGTKLVYTCNGGEILLLYDWANDAIIDLTELTEGMAEQAYFLSEDYLYLYKVSEGIQKREDGWIYDLKNGIVEQTVNDLRLDNLRFLTSFYGQYYYDEITYIIDFRTGELIDIEGFYHLSDWQTISAGGNDALLRVNREKGKVQYTDILEKKVTELEIKHTQIAKADYIWSMGDTYMVIVNETGTEEERGVFLYRLP